MKVSRRLAVILAVTVVVVLGLVTVRPVVRKLLAAPPPHIAVALAAGDISSCTDDGDSHTADLLEHMPGTILALGDTVYPDGTAAEYQDCYGPTWGRFHDRTRPIPGNHEYRTTGASAYFDYFGASAGDPQLGYYSFDLGKWHVIGLNTQCEFVGGCYSDSQQERWLRADLAGHPALCSLAMMHTPRFTSGPHGDAEWLDAFWRDLYERGVEMVLSGDDHDYERFAPQNRFGVADQLGVRQFVVGTGGVGVGPLRAIEPNSEAANATTHGVLRLQLESDRYSWSFVPVAGASFTDAGSAECHGPPPAPRPGDIVAMDAFQRSTTDGWGSAPGYGRWLLSGPAGDFSVSNNAGTIVLATDVTLAARLVIDALDVDVRGTLSIDSLPANGDVFAYIFARAHGDSLYRAGIMLGRDGSGAVTVTKIAGGHELPLATEVPAPNLHVAAAGKIAFRFVLGGPEIQFKAWPASSDEPSGWQADAVDTTPLETRGDVGLGAFTNAPLGSERIRMSFDDFTVKVADTSPPSGAAP